MQRDVVTSANSAPIGDPRDEPEAGLGLLRERLRDTTAQARLVVAHGPAGSGKSTFLRQHAAAWHGEVTWLECDALDRSAARFAARVSRLLGGDGEHDLDRVVEALNDRLIVVDEIDRLPDSDAPAVLDALVARLPPSCGLAMGSRRLDALPDVERWRVAGELVCVGGHDLRFRLWEVERLFREVYRVPLSVGEVHRVSSASGGWPVALRYFAVTLRQAPAVDRASLIDQLGRNNVQLRRYLRTQVLGMLPVGQRASLRRLAVLDRVDTGRAKLLAPELAHDLVSLVSIGVFDDNQADGTFRMHSLLRTELLEELAAELSEAHVSELYLEAARVLEQLGDHHEACLARARAGHTGAADQPFDAVALLAAGTRSIDVGNVTTGRDQLRSVVAMLAGVGGSAHAEHQLRLVNDWVDPPPGSPTSWVAAVRQLLSGRRVQWSGEHVDLVDAVRSFMVGDLDSSYERFAAEAACEPRTLVGELAELCAGCLALVAGRPDAAARHGQQVWNRCRDGGVEALALVAEALILAEHGSADEMGMIARLGEAREDAMFRMVMHLIAAFGGRLSAEQRAKHLDRASVLAAGCGCEAVSRRVRLLALPPDRTVADLVDRVEPAPSAIVDRGAGDELAVTCIGEFSIELAGNELDASELRPIHREVLAMMTARPGVAIHREEIAQLVWPGRDASSARRSLHTAISALRSWFERHDDPLGRARIERVADAYVLAIDPGASDLGRLHSLLERVRRRSRGGEGALDLVRAAVDAFHDEPYREFGPVEWAVGARRSLVAGISDVMHSVKPTGQEDRAAWEALRDRVRAVSGVAAGPSTPSEVGSLR